MKIGKNVTIKDSVVMNNVTIKDNVTIINSAICSGCKIGSGQKVENTELALKTTLQDKDGKEVTPASRRGSILP